MDIRKATPADETAVSNLCAAVWPDRDVEYLDRIYPDWIRGDNRHTLVIVDNGRLVAIAQAVMLTDTEAWYQGLRVHPDVRGEGVAGRLLGALDSWARKAGATVTRNLIYSWNTAGMGLVTSLGYRAATSFRFARPRPAATSSGSHIEENAAIAWDVWEANEVRAACDGLVLDREESWALRTGTRADMEAAEKEDRLLVINSPDGQAMAYRGRQYETDGGTGVEYATATWSNTPTAVDLFRAIERDAAKLKINEIRVPVPERPTRIADAAYARVSVDAEPHFVFEKALATD